ncbi:MAG: hypothetical protein RIS86_1744 [Planctomycetota bacterium]|jgi:hypothetical protein
MLKILRRVTGFLLALLAGAAVNMLLLGAVGALVPPPEGVDPQDLESIRAHIADYAPVQFVAPFVAHAGGTLAGAFLATLLAGLRGPAGGLAIGAFFLIGGVMMVAMIPETPRWFAATDLVGAYLPMGWLGWRLARTIRGRRAGAVGIANAPH